MAENVHEAFNRLRAVPILSHLTPGQLMELARATTRERFIAGEDIMHQGELSDRFFIVDQGSVHFRKTDLEGFEHPAGSAVPGDYFGLPMFTTLQPAEYTAEAHGEAYLYVLEREKFDELLHQHPDILKNLPEVIERRRLMTRGLVWLTPGEIVVRSTHRHWSTLLLAELPPIAGAVILGVILLGIYYFGLIADPALMTAVVIGAALLIILWGAYSVADWADDDFIVTNKRVAHAERVVFLVEQRNEIPIERIQTVLIQRESPVEKLFGIGRLEIRSAGREDTHIRFDGVERPEDIKRDILMQRAQLRARNQAVERERFRRRVGSDLRHYVFRESPKQAQAAAPVVHHSWRKRMGNVWGRMFGYQIRSGESIIWRKHWLALLEQTSRWLAVLLFLLLFYVVYLFVPFLRIIPTIIFPIGYLVAVAVAIGGVVWQWEDWRNDLYEVNDRAIIDIERRPLYFGEVSKEAPLINVQDAKSLRPNPLHKVLDFGNVEISVAGGSPPLTFYNVPRPDQIVEEVFRRMDAAQLKRRERETAQQSALVVDALVAYHRLLAEKEHRPEPPPEASPAPEQKLAPGTSESGTGTGPGPAPQPPPAGPPALQDDTLSEFPRVEEVD